MASKPAVAPTPSFVLFFSGLRRRDQAAWWELTRRYTRRLIGLTRQCLDVRLRAKLDPEDVVQSVFRLLDQRLQGAGLQAQSWEHLWAMLALLTANRCSNWFRHYFGTQKRKLEAPLPEGRDEEEQEVLAIASDPTPEEAAELAEEVRRLLPRLDEQTARIYWLGLLGYTDDEIASELKVTEARVRIAREDCGAKLRQTVEASRG